MIEPHEELTAIAVRLTELAAQSELPVVKEPIQRLTRAIHRVGKAHSGSWLGYHSLVYYAGFDRPPPGAHFSQEWGLMDVLNSPTSGDWQEYDPETIEAAIHVRAGYPFLGSARVLANSAHSAFTRARSDVLIVLENVDTDLVDSVLLEIRTAVEQLGPLSADDAVNHVRPKGLVMTRDTRAMGQRYWTPPHVALAAEVEELLSPAAVCAALAEEARKASSHLARKQRILAGKAAARPPSVEAISKDESEPGTLDNGRSSTKLANKKLPLAKLERRSVKQAPAPLYVRFEGARLVAAPSYPTPESLTPETRETARRALHERAVRLTERLHGNADPRFVDQLKDYAAGTAPDAVLNIIALDGDMLTLRRYCEAAEDGEVNPVLVEGLKTLYSDHAAFAAGFSELAEFREQVALAMIEGTPDPAPVTRAIEAMRDDPEHVDPAIPEAIAHELQRPVPQTEEPDPRKWFRLTRMFENLTRLLNSADGTAKAFVALAGTVTAAVAAAYGVLKALFPTMPGLF